MKPLANFSSCVGHSVQSISLLPFVPEVRNLSCYGLACRIDAVF
jgi:hypothetical protein